MRNYLSRINCIHRDDLVALFVGQANRAHLDDGFAVLGGVLRVEDFVQFFERAVFGFDEEEVDDAGPLSVKRGRRVAGEDVREFEAVPEDEEDVELTTLLASLSPVTRADDIPST